MELQGSCDSSLVFVTYASNSNICLVSPFVAKSTTSLHLGVNCEMQSVNICESKSCIHSIIITCL